MTKIDTDENWRYSAKCAGDDPTRYELDPHKRMDKQARELDKQARARDLCRGCPVVKECAIEALHPLAIGTVRAGVWITGVAGNNYRRMLPARNALKLIATGRITADQLHEDDRLLGHD